MAHIPILAALLAATPAPPVVSDLTLRDGARGKDLEVRVVHPVAGTALPLIVFSHGAGGSREGVDQLGQAWAEAGYVVVAPTHADSIALRRRAGETVSLRDTLDRAMTPASLEERVRDVRFLLDSLPLLEERVEALRGRLDRATVGMAGHSMGAMTGLAVAGARTTAGDLADPRPLAFLLLSPQGQNRLLGPDAWAGLVRPTMFMTGSEDRGMAGRPPEWRREPFEKSPPGNKVLVWIEGATHASFTRPGDFGRRIDAARQVEVWETVKTASLVFWDAQLRRDAEARAALASLAATLAGRAAVESR